MIASTPPRLPADSFTPVVLQTTVAPVLHVHSRVPIAVHVKADPGVLDIRNSKLKIEAALAPECSGTFAQTERSGIVLMNRPLSPQPVAGRAYSATARTTYGAPRRTGRQSVCVWLVQVSDQRVFASDESLRVTVRAPLTRRRRRH